MPRPIPSDVRRKIVRDRQAGTPYAQLAHETGYSVSGVKKIWRLFQTQGEAGLTLHYNRCGRKSPFDAELRKLADTIKDGDQGAPYVRSLLEHRYPDRRIPHERTLQRWWKAQGTNRVKISRQRHGTDWSKEVHHTWQIDGKEQISLANDQQVSWINIADEARGSALQTVVFPPVSDDENSPWPST